MDELQTELAKAAGQVVVDTAKDTRAALGTLFGDALREFGLTLGDQARLFRFKNLVKIMDKVESIRRERGLTQDQLSALPFGDSLRVIEAASLEEEDEVQELWARLIANITGTDGDATAKKVFIDLLRSMSPIEANFLDLLWENSAITFPTLDDVKRFNQHANAAFELRWRQRPEADRLSAIQNLVRLRCVSLRPAPINAHNLLGRVPRELAGSSFNHWAFVDVREFEKLLVALTDQIAIASGAKEHVPSKGVPLQANGFYNPPLSIEAPELNYALTSLGRSLMAACALEPVGEG